MKKRIEPKNIAVIRTDRIGEVLLSTVAVDALKKRYPSARIFFVTSKYSLPIVDDRKDIEGVMTVETIRAKGGLVATAVKLAKYLRREKIDTAVVLNPHKALHLGCFLAGVKNRAGYDRKFGFLLNIRTRDLRDKGEKHETEYTMDVMKLLDAAYPPLLPRLPVNSMADEEVSEIIAKAGLKEDRPVVVIHPSSSNPAKIWPPENYMELMHKMKTELDCDVAVIGGVGEGIITDKVRHIKDLKVFDLAGKFDLKQLAAFLKRSSLFIGNDTGPMHMAAALGVPVIAIFGRNLPGSSPVRWRPLGEGHVVFYRESVCRPCADPRCPHDYRCLKMVKVDDVFAAVKEILSRDHV